MLNEILKLRESLKNKKISPLKFSTEYSKLIDSFFIKKFSCNSDFLIIATGSYGRQRLSPFSDIDVIFLLKEKNQEIENKIVENFIYPLWDLKLHLGYSIRTYSNFYDFIYQDLKEWAKIFDLRLVCGDKQFFSKFINKIEKGKKKEFLRELFILNDERREKFGNTVYLLEPDIKNSPGGLRDINLILWSLEIFPFKNLLKKEEQKEIKDSYNFILKIRNILHIFAKKENDHLNFEYQKKISDYFGISEVALMRKYYFKADIIDYYYEYLRDNLVERHFSPINFRKKIDNLFFIKDYKLHISKPKKISENPILILKAFDIMQKYRIFPSFELKTLIRKNVKKIEKINTDKNAIKIFFRILERDVSTGFFLKLMNKLNFFSYFIPEFKKIRYRITYDFYHKYTIDMHSIYVVIKLRALFNGEFISQYPFISAIALNIQKRRYLLLAGLLHDIGKGIKGKESHLVKGAKIVDNICKRFGLSENDRELVVFLVKHHTLMTDTALKRDIKNEEEILKFANIVKSVKRLNFLYLLSFADLNSVSDEAFDKWKNDSFQELYIKTFICLTKKDTSFLKIEEKIASIKSYAIDNIPKKDYLLFEKFLQNLSKKYILAKDEKTVISLFYSIKDVKKLPHLIFIEEEKGKVIKIVLYTYNYPGIFNKAVGILTLNNLNILSAEIYTNNDGTIIDIFYTKPIYFDKYFREKFEKIKEDFKKFLDYKISNEDIYEVLKNKLNKKIKLKAPLIPQIEFNNEDSAIFTIIEIIAPDYPGLLFEISEIFYKFNIEIQSAKITTQGLKAIDTFYVTDLNGNKILDKNAQQRIKEEFLMIIEKKL